MSGTAAVVTPVWLAAEGAALYVVTDRASGKVERLRRSQAVRLAPCTHVGRPLGPAVDARPRVLPPAQDAPARPAPDGGDGRRRITSAPLPVRPKAGAPAGVR